MLVLALDPGVTGAIVVTDGEKILESYAMPVLQDGKDRLVCPLGVSALILKITRKHGKLPTFLERAYAGGMGVKSAFNYGRGFQVLVSAITAYAIPVTYVEPARWTKEMHEGTSAELRPKVRSLQAVKRLYPHLVPMLPKRPKGGFHDGPIDALLIAGYGIRRLTGGRRGVVEEIPDFF